MVWTHAVRWRVRSRGSRTDQELKKLRRSDLLELLIAQEKENERLRSQVEQLEKRLADRAIDLEQAGSIAEAALRLNGVFQAAQAAADQYLENIRRLSEEPEAPILKEGPAADEEVPGEQGRKGR